jgi:hypothetical protein
MLCALTNAMLATTACTSAVHAGSLAHSKIQSTRLANGTVAATSLTHTGDRGCSIPIDKQTADP